MRRNRKDTAEPAEPREPPRLATGIRGLDTVLGGGLIPRRLYLVKGPPGAGKSVLAAQLSFERARAGDRVVYVTMLAEFHSALLENLRTLDFFDASLVAQQITFVSGFRALDEGGLHGLYKLMRTMVQKTGARLLVLDGLAGATDRVQSPDEVRHFARDVAAASVLLGCTAVCTAPEDGIDRRWLAVVENVADGLIDLGQVAAGLRVARTLEVFKLRGSSHLDGKHVFEISRAGAVVHPRTEARLERPGAAEVVPGRLAFGIEPLDGMLQGGVMRASSTAILGAPGAGKTILGLQFLAEGARRGERSLYFGFYETPARLIAKAEGIGVPFGKYRRSGLVELIWQPALEDPIDALVERLLDAVGRHRAERVFIDGMDGFRMSALFAERLPRFFTALANELRARGVATLLSEETDLGGAALPVHPENLSSIFENILLLRYVEVRSQLHRLFSVLKMRESDYDSAVHEFRITSGGIVVAPTFESAEAVLGGRSPDLRAALARTAGPRTRARKRR